MSGAAFFEARAVAQLGLIEADGYRAGAAYMAGESDDCRCPYVGNKALAWLRGWCCAEHWEVS